MSSTILFDRQCGFCIWTVHVMLRLDRRDRLRAESIQQRRDLLPGLDDEQALNSFHLVDGDGRVRSAGAALAEVLTTLRPTRVFGRLLARVPRVAERLYRLVADHRGQLARAVPERAKARARERILGHDAPTGVASCAAPG